MSFPRMFSVRQSLAGPVISDVSATVRSAIRELNLQQLVKNGQTVAITAGSRGIANIAVIIRTVVSEMTALGLKPFIVPAMGSHGGATSHGQLRVLEHYGITEESMGCPLKSAMDVIQVGEVHSLPVFCDANAWSADHIAVVARVKAHTDFEGEFESGLFKMMAVGLGKRQGAALYHRAGHQSRYAEVFPTVGRAVLDSGRILFGLATVENGSEQTARIRALLPPQFAEVERELLLEAKALMARIPFDAVDLLIVDELGKNISGAGMDPNVIGRAFVQKPPGKPVVRRLFVRDLTMESEGNAVGLGLADFTTRRLVQKIDYAAMYTNAVTAGVPEGAKIPIAFESDREAISAGLGMIGLTPSDRARVVRIKNTLHLTDFDCSDAMLPEVRANPRLEALTAPQAMEFDGEGNLRSL